MSTTPWGDQTQLSSLVFGHLAILAVLDDVLPLDAREVDAPLVAVPGRGRAVGVLGEHFPGDRELDRPELVLVARVVERAVDVSRRLQAGDLPLVDRRAAVAIGLLEEQVPLGVEGVDLDLVVLVVVAVGVDEDLEVVVLEDDRVVLGQGAPDVRFLQLGGDVEVRVVPEHLGPGLEPWERLHVSLDVDERVGPGDGLPGLLVELAVDRDRLGRPVADIALGKGKAHVRPWLSDARRLRDRS